MPRRVADRGAHIEKVSRMSVEFLVQRQDQRPRYRRYQQTSPGVTSTPCPFRRAISLDQRVGVEHDAITDNRELAGPHHAGRQQRQLVGGAVDDQRVAGIVPALKADNDVRLSATQSTILPLPSSPHWEPTTTTFAMAHLAAIGARDVTPTRPERRPRPTTRRTFGLETLLPQGAARIAGKRPRMLMV